MTLPAPGGEHAASHGPGETRNDAHPVQHYTDAAYSAVLLGLLVGAALLLLDHSRRWYRSYAPQFVGNPVPAAVTNLPRGPTTPFLQVVLL